MRFPIRALPALLLAAAAACGGSPPPAALAPPRPDSAATLVLRPGDVIRIRVFDHEELSGEYLIDENAVLLLPLLGETNVRDLAVPELRTRIRAGYAQLFTRAFITITPLFRVAVLGEVMRPGLYSVDPTLSVYDVIALAGGALRSANERNLRLIRGGELHPLNLSAVSIAQSTLRELGVRSGDQLLVPRKAITREDWALLLQIANLAISIIVFLQR